MAIELVHGPPWTLSGATAKDLLELDVVALGDGGGLGDHVLAVTGWWDAVELAGSELRQRRFNCT
jgi:hypothetical protein